MKEEIISHWHPNITINIVHDFTQWTQGAVPPPLDEYVQFTPAADRYVMLFYLFFLCYIQVLSKLPHKRKLWYHLYLK